MKNIGIFVVLGIMYIIATVISLFCEELTASSYFLAGIVGTLIVLSYKNERRL